MLFFREGKPEKTLFGEKSDILILIKERIIYFIRKKTNLL